MELWGGMGMDEDDAACLVSCCCAVAERVEGRPSSMPERLYTPHREISVCKFMDTHKGVSVTTIMREKENRTRKVV
jgi:hypothetical protein